MDHLESEFGASPLGKDNRDGSAATTAPLKMTNVDAAPLPDIYGDLYGNNGEGNVLLKTQVAQLKDQCNKQEDLIKQLQQEVDSLTIENTELQTLKTTLINNISSLFNTAKLEIQRKDDEIKELRGKIASSGGIRGGRSGGGGRSSSRPSDRGRDHSREDRHRHRSISEGKDRGRERSSGGARGGGR